MGLKLQAAKKMAAGGQFGLADPPFYHQAIPGREHLWISWTARGKKSLASCWAFPPWPGVPSALRKAVQKGAAQTACFCLAMRRLLIPPGSVALISASALLSSPSVCLNLCRSQFEPKHKKGAGLSEVIWPNLRPPLKCFLGCLDEFTPATDMWGGGREGQKPTLEEERSHKLI